MEKFYLILQLEEKAINWTNLAAKWKNGIENILYDPHDGIWFVDT